MEPVFQAIIIVVIAAAAAGTVYKTVPGMSLLLSMAAALLALFLCIGLLEPLAAFFRDAIAVSKLSGVYTGPLLKCMTISILTMIGESLCKDAGQAAGACAVQLVGVAAARAAADAHVFDHDRRMLMKKRLLVLLTVLLVLAACTPGAFAYDVAAEQAADFGTASLESALPEQAYDAFGELSVADAAQPQSLLAKLWAYVLHEGGGAVASAARNAALLLAIVFLSALCASLSVSGACGKVTQMAGTVAVAALSVAHVTSCITAGSEALATLRDFSKILLPSMCAAAAASGAATSAAAKYAATSLFLDVLLSAETAVLLPLLYLYAGTVICVTTLENDVLASLSGLLRKAFRLLLIGFASVFTLYLSLTGILTGSAAAAKAVKTAVSAALPVVGSIVADAASTVTSSAAILRSGIGIVGVVSVAAMCVTPYLQFAVHYVLYKLAAGIAESFADKRVGRLIDGFADVYGFLLGMVGVASLILFLSIVSSMKAVTG